MPEENIKNGAVTLFDPHIGRLLRGGRHRSATHRAPLQSRRADQTRSITFRLRDNFSGIGSYRPHSTGSGSCSNAIPMQGTITHTFDDSRTPKGRSYTLQLTVTDNCGNKTVWKRTITR